MTTNAEGLSIYASCGEFAVPRRAWQLMLLLAGRYGWDPRGTTPPDELAIDCGLWPAGADWDGRYLPSYGQHITDEDTQMFARALERALPDIPDHDATEAGEGGSDPWGRLASASADIKDNLVEAFGGSKKAVLRDFIDHCRETGGLWLY